MLASQSHSLSQTSTSTTADSKLHLTISLAHAILYAFIGDAAAAQLVFLNSSPSKTESAPLVLTPVVWLLGALLWFMELAIYLVTRWRERSAAAEEGRHVSWEKEDGYSLLRQEDSDEELEAS